MIKCVGVNFKDFSEIIVGFCRVIPEFVCEIPRWGERASSSIE